MVGVEDGYLGEGGREGCVGVKKLASPLLGSLVLRLHASAGFCIAARLLRRVGSLEALEDLGIATG